MAGGVVDEELRVAHLLRREEEGLLLLLREPPFAQALEVHARLGALDPEAELLGRHLEREEADDVRLVDRQVRRDVQGEGRLAHPRPRRDDDQVGLLEALRQRVQPREAGREAGQHRAAAVDLLDLLLVLLGDRESLTKPPLIEPFAISTSSRCAFSRTVSASGASIGVADRAPRLEDDERAGARTRGRAARSSRCSRRPGRGPRARRGRPRRPPARAAPSSRARPAP